MFINLLIFRMIMRIILTRHGETVENKAGICQGQIIQGKLTEEGIEQAKKVALRLKAEKIDAIYSSDLARAADTAREIAKFHPNAPFHLIKELRERDHGSNSGRKKKEISYGILPEDAESDEELVERAQKLIDSIYQKHSRSTVLLIGHGAVNAAIISAITKMDFRDVIHMEKWRNTNVSIFEINEDRSHKMHCLNCTNHLEPKN